VTVKRSPENCLAGLVRSLALSLCVAATLAVLLVACGGDAEPAETPLPSPAGSPTPVPDLFDFGSAPEPYPSSLEANGARHADLTRAWIGDKVDGEEDWDRWDENDGVAGADPVAFVITNNDWDGDLFVNVLVDLNEDGDWNDEEEWMIRNRKVDVAPGSSTEVYTDFALDIGGGIAPLTRMRLTLTGVELPDFDGRGEFEIGETEDHSYRLRGFQRGVHSPFAEER